MGIYLRKSISLGPLRFNLSGSGIGVSAGVKGLRVGTGPRGNYVHVGRHGLYYRTTFPNAAPTGGALPVQPALLPRTAAPDGLTEIESGSVAAMTDSSSADLLKEINEKAQLTTWWPIALLSEVFLALVLLAAPSSLSSRAQLAIAVPLVAGAAVAVVWVKRRDELRKTVVLMYDLDTPAEEAYQGLINGFDWLASSARVWHLEAEGRNMDWKRQAGATTIVRRSSIALWKAEPPRLKTNVLTPVIPAGRQTLYFFPDRVLVYDRQSVGAVSYRELQADASTTRFIEDSFVPADAVVVGHTWQYVNKKGGPDRRFKNNPQLSIANYGELTLRSATGLNEAFQTSKAEAPTHFRDGLRVLSTALGTIAPLATPSAADHAEA